MKRLILATIVLSALLYWIPARGQSFSTLLFRTEQIKAEFGETDKRYLDTLSLAISAAFNEQKAEEANRYRLVHAEIVKRTKGECSLEYAEDLWRLGNVSAFKGEQYTFDTYRKAAAIYEKLKAQDEFPYCDIMWRFYCHYDDAQEWQLAADYLKKHIHYYKPWINKEWKGNTLSDLGYANICLILGNLYSLNLKDLLSANDAYLQCVDYMEKNGLVERYEYSWMPYQALSINFQKLEDNVNAAIWQRRLTDVYALTQGEESDNFFQALADLRYRYWTLRDLDSIKVVSKTLIAKIESKSKRTGVSCQKDSLYLVVQKDYVVFCSALDDDPGVVEYAPIALKAFENAGLRKSDDYLEILHYLISAYHSTRDYLSAYSLYPEYDELSQILRKRDTDEYWSYLGSKCEGLSFLYKAQEYGAAADELRTLTSRMYGPNSKESLYQAIGVAEHYHSLEMPDREINEIERCYEILNSGECRLLNQIDSAVTFAGLHTLEGGAFIGIDNERAEKALFLAVDENKACGREQYNYGPYQHLGIIYHQEKRDPQSALTYYDNARRCLETLGDNSSIIYFSVLDNIGLCYQELGMNSQALAIFDQMSQTAAKNYGKHHILYGVAEQNKSLLYATITDYKSALSCCKEALECYRETLGENSERYATALNNLGTWQETMGNLKESKATLLKALSIFENLNSPNCVNSYINLITVYAAERDWAKVQDMTNRAETLIKTKHWENTSIAASLYGTVGYTLASNNVPGGAPYLKYALDITEQNSGNTSVQYLSGLITWGMATFLDKVQSEENISSFIDSYKRVYLSNSAYFNGAEREAMISGPRFSQIKNIAFSSRNKGEQDLNLYDFLLFNKGLLLGTTLNYAKAVYASGNQEIIGKYRELVRLNRIIKGEPQSDVKAISADEAKAKASSLERDITFYLRQNGGYTDGLNYTYGDIQKSLGKDELAVEFVSYHNFVDGKSYYAALLARSDWKVPKLVQLCTKDDLEKVADLPPGSLYGETPESEEAYKLIWAPINQYLRNVKSVYFSPAGYINNLAIEHLHDGKRRFSSLYNAFRMTSTREVCNRNSQPSYSKAVLYGGLRYDEDDADMITESLKARSESFARPETLRGFNSSMKRNGWEALPGTLEEVKHISEILHSHGIVCDTYTSGKGNEESFKALSEKGFGILHIATHGFYMTEQEARDNEFYTTTTMTPLKRSGLLMAGANKAWKGESVPEGIEDGVLLASEIASLDFNNCDIVVLSACDTGLGDISDEGVFGLQRAFKNAGVGTIIMSLWKVDDTATSRFMSYFYEALASGTGRHGAFRSAQDRLRQEFPEPYYWAAFIMLD